MFPETTDEKFFKTLMNILDLSAKDNAYKFAFAKFLLEYCNSHNETETHVDFSTIAKYFLEYYWLQECKYKLRQAHQVSKKPEIIKIIQREFPKSYYPQSFQKIMEIEPEKIQRCIEKIKKKCFHNVTWRFQKIKYGRTNKEIRIFFDYKYDRIIHENKKFIDLDYGINLNPKAMSFFKRYNLALNKAVILEWTRFSEILNGDVPKLIPKIEGKLTKRISLTKFRRMLEPFQKRCFYCNNKLSSAPRQTHVEHVIPFDFIAEDNIWNFVLACQGCNLMKLGSLPPKKFLDKLIKRNKICGGRIPDLKKSLEILGAGWEKSINDNYVNAKSHGYAVLSSIP